MKFFPSNKAMVLVYVLFLVNIAVVMWLVIYNNSFIYSNNLDYQKTSKTLKLDIYKKANNLFTIADFYNSNWNWFTDDIWCPWDVTMSWVTLRQSSMISNLSYQSWSIYCEGTYYSNPYYIYFNNSYSDFVSSYYEWDLVDVSSWVWISLFTNDLTLITFSSWSSDNIDDDFDSDNYKVTSTWSTATWTYYPWSYQDDDVFHRKTIIWYIEPNSPYFNVFWNNPEVSSKIDSNSNNSDTLNQKLSQTSSWYLVLSTDSSSDLKVVEFNKDLYDNDKVLSAKAVYNWYDIIWNWYIILSSWELSLSPILTWNELDFDFVNNYYWVFLKNNTDVNLTYELSWESDSWTGVYIVPIDDSWDFYSFLWNDIVIDSDSKYTYDQFEIMQSK